MRKTLRIVTATLGTAASTVSLMLMPTAAVAAPACTYPSHTNNSAGYGYVVGGALARRSGPSTSCGIYGYATNNVKIYYHCYTIGEFINTDPYWVWGRIEGTQQEGWFSMDYLNSEGYFPNYCG
jgi:hypothetical protein